MNDLMNRNWQRAHVVIVQLRLDYNLLIGNPVLEIMIKTCQPRPQGEKEEQGWHGWLVPAFSARGPEFDPRFQLLSFLCSFD